MGAVTSNTFEVIDADVTGNEEVSFQSMSSKYYDRTDDSTTTTITFDIDTEHLYDGTEYTVDWEICDTDGWFEGCSSSFGFTIGGSGEITFTATASGTHSETITYTDPGLPYETYDSVANEWVYHAGVENNSLVFGADLNVQGVPLDDNTSEPFVMGGKLWEDYSRALRGVKHPQEHGCQRQRLLLPRPRKQACVELHRQLPPLRRRYHNAC